MSALKSGSTKLGFGKVIVVGQGHVGKSDLVNSLEGKKFEETVRTIGVEQNLLQLGKVTLNMGGGKPVVDFLGQWNGGVR